MPALARKSPAFPGDVIDRSTSGMVNVGGRAMPVSNLAPAANMLMTPPSLGNALAGPSPTPTPGVNLLAPTRPLAPPATIPLPAQSSAIPPQAAPLAAPVGAAPAATPPPMTAPSAATMGAAPNDPISAFAQQIRGMGLPPAQMIAAADALQHGVEAVSNLLDRRTITPDALKSALDTAKQAGKFSGDAIDGFAGKLPPTSDQGALRSALEAHLETSITQLIGLHTAAQASGVDIPTALKNAGTA